jgi:protein TonB
MRTLLLIGMLLTCAATNVWGQTSDTQAVDPNKVYELFDTTLVPPVFPGGEKEMYSYLTRSISYPAEARKNGIQGIIPVTFVVDEVGKITNINVLRDVGGGLGAEAKRVVNLMPSWTPGSVQGVPVKVRYTLPIRFSLGK